MVGKRLEGIDCTVRANTASRARRKRATRVSEPVDLFRARQRQTPALPAARLALSLSLSRIRYRLHRFSILLRVKGREGKNATSTAQGRSWCPRATGRTPCHKEDNPCQYSPAGAVYTRTWQNSLLLLPLGEVRDKERERRVDAALLEVRLKLGLDTLVEVVKLPPRAESQPMISN